MTTTVTKVFGANVRRLRLDGEHTLDDLAMQARRHGLAWSSGRVGSIRKRPVPVTVEMLLATASALGALRGSPVTAADLLRTDEPVALTDTLTIDGQALAAAVSGMSAGLSGTGTLTAKVEVMSESDRILCRDLGVDVETGVQAMHRLWGHLASAEHDLRAGPDANQQRRGIVWPGQSRA